MFALFLSLTDHTNDSAHNDAHNDVNKPAYSASSLFTNFGECVVFLLQVDYLLESLPMRESASAFFAFANLLSFFLPLVTISHQRSRHR